MKKLSEIGEREAIKLIFKILKKESSTVELGDDCAALDFKDDYILVSTDMISEETHISNEMTPFQIGWFIVAINLSDIAAKGGIPLGLVLSYGLPKDTSDVFLTEMTKGANACAQRFGTSIIGGDTKSTNEITICGTAIGIVKKDEFLSRKGACLDDIVAVTGYLGRSGAGYLNIKNKILEDNISKFLFEPIPRLKEGRLLAKENCITSCMDISDGLSSSLYQLSELNNLGFEIFREKIPISKEILGLKNKYPEINVFDYAIHFGGDYELLVTLPKKCFENTKKKLEKIGSNLFDIGRVIKNNEIILNTYNEKKILENKGYEHFRNHIF